MKIKGQPGVGFDAIPRISSGFYIYMRDDDLIVAKRPDQPLDTSRCGEFYRAQMQGSAAMIGYAISQEIEGAHNFQINSNDTWKDILTRAQFGTLFMITLTDGTVYHPADHTCPPLTVEEEGELPWTLVKEWSFAVDGATNSIVLIPEAPFTELLVFYNRVTNSAGSTRGLQVSLDNGSTWRTGAADYSYVDNVGNIGNQSTMLTPGSGAGVPIFFYQYFPTPLLANKQCWCMTPSAYFCAQMYNGTLDAPTAFRYFTNAGNFNGGSVHMYMK